MSQIIQESRNCSNCTLTISRTVNIDVDGFSLKSYSEGRGKADWKWKLYGEKHVSFRTADPHNSEAWNIHTIRWLLLFEELQQEWLPMTTQAQHRQHNFTYWVTYLKREGHTRRSHLSWKPETIMKPLHFCLLFGFKPWSHSVSNTVYFYIHKRWELSHTYEDPTFGCSHHALE